MVSALEPSGNLPRSLSALTGTTSRSGVVVVKAAIQYRIGLVANNIRLTVCKKIYTFFLVLVVSQVVIFISITHLLAKGYENYSLAYYLCPDHLLCQYWNIILE
jgi:hypothetical protein